MAKKKNPNVGDRPDVARVYIRVSHVGNKGKPGVGEVISPDMQLNEAKQYTALYLKNHVLDVDASTRHADIDTSASRLKWQKRQGLVAHLEAAKRGEINALIVFKLSRFARNAKEGLELFDLFEAAGCAIHCIKEQIDTTTSAGRMVRTVLLAVAEMEAENISEFVKAASKTRALKGLPHGALPFWLSKDGDQRYVLNERVRDIRRLVELRLQGYGYARIARILNAEGVRSSSSGKWTTNKVSRHLYEHGLSLLQGHYTYGVDLEEGNPDRVVVPGLFPAVITEEEAELVRAGNRKMQEMYGDGGPRKAANTKFVLSGVFRCGVCGGAMRSHNASPSNRARRSSYECRAACEDAVSHPSGYHVSGDMAEDAVLRVIRLAATDYKQQFDNPPPVKSSETTDGTAVAKQIANVTLRISRLVDALTDGVIRRQDFQPKYDALKAEQERLQASLQQMDSAAAVRRATSEALSMSGPSLTVDQARRLVLAFVKRVDGPVGVDPARIGLPKAKRGRALWVTLSMPLADGTTRILSPMYDARFKGERVLLDRE